MAKRKKRAWDMTNPLYRYLHKRKGYKTPLTTTPQKKVTRKMTKRRRYRSAPRRSYFSRRFHRRGKMTIPIAPIAGLAAGMIGGPNSPLSFAMSGNWEQLGTAVVARYTGYNMNTGGFDWGSLSVGLGPLVTGIAVHKVVGGWLGVNRMLARSKVPIVRL